MRNQHSGKFHPCVDGLQAFLRHWVQGSLSTGTREAAWVMMGMRTLRKELDTASAQPDYQAALGGGFDPPQAALQVSLGPSFCLGGRRAHLKP